ncbi:hypothetical protein GF337_09145, partial [candidate division KSB1 bacterium]|nr:hypothetical protein [candidate division KSB1 bacterium]
MKKLLTGGIGNGFHNNGKSGLKAIDLFAEVPFQHELQFLYDNLELKIGHLDRKAITITSSTMGEGSSTLAAYYALQLARGHFHPVNGANGSSGEATRDVLLIDANFRHPSIHDLFDIENRIGFADLLRKKVEMRNCITYLEHANLNIITTGQDANRSIKEFNSEALKNVMSQLREHFAYIIIDSAPVLSNLDTIAMTQLTNGLALVVRAETT